ncbi:MAG: SUMF1/EgtB/PvdO family nonheme iron enzyme [Planctomycetota bacterium]
MRRGSLLLLLAVPLLAGLSWGQDAELARRIRSLDDKLFFVSHFDRGYAELAAEVRSLHEGNLESPEVAELKGRVYVAWAKHLSRRGEDSDAFDRYEEVRALGEGHPLYREATIGAAGAARTVAKQRGETTEALGWLRKALERYRAVDEKEASASVRVEMADLSSREGLRAYRGKDYARALELLGAVERDFPDSIGETDAAEALEFLREGTGVITLDLVTVPVAGTPLIGGTRIRLAPRETGEKHELEAFTSLRWTVGEYDCSILSAEGSETPLVTLPLLLEKDGASLRVPEKFPPDMAYVPGAAGAAPFFIQRKEVTVGDYRRFDASYVPAYAGEDLPAHGIAFDRAKAYAAFASMKLPSREQWRRAVFGTGNARYPWGGEPPSKERCNISEGRPTPAGSKEDGASVPHGLLDAAGNVWEWLDDGYAIGGGYRLGRLEVRLAGWDRPVDFLRDPVPDQSVWKKMTGKTQRDFEPLYIREGSLDEVGLRCVIELQ